MAADALRDLDAALSNAGPPQAGGQAPPASGALADLDAVMRGELTPGKVALRPSGGLNQRSGEFATGVNDMLAAAAGAPMDVSAWLGNQLGRGINYATGSEIFTPRPTIGGSEQIRRGVEATIGRTGPTDTTGRLLYGAGQGVGGAVGAAGVGTGLRALGRAPAVAEALIGGRTAGGQAVNVGLGGISGAGSAAGEGIAGDDPTARLVGNLVGGLAAPGAAIGAGYGARRGLEYLRPALQPERVAAERLAGAAENLGGARYDPLGGELVPGSRPSLAQATDDEGLFRLEDDLIARFGAAETWTPAQRELAEMARTQGEARTAAARGIGDPNASPVAVQNVLRDKLAALDTEADANLGAAQRNAEQAFSGLGPRLTVEDRGAFLRDQLEGAKRVSRANESRLWEAVDPQNELTIDLADVAKRAKEIVGELPKTARPPEGEEKAIFDVAGLGGTAVPFRDMTGLRSRLLQAIRDERMSAGESPALRRMQMLRESLDNTIGTATTRAAEADPSVAARIAGADVGTTPGQRAGDLATGGQPAASGAVRPASGRALENVPAGVLRDEGAAGGLPANAGGVPGLPAAAGRSAEPRRPPDLIEFLVDRGGVQRTSDIARGDLRALDAQMTNKGYFGRLAHDSPNAMTLDEARELAVEFGYLHPDSDITDLLSALDRNIKGGRIFSETDNAAHEWREWQRTSAGMDRDAAFDTSIPFPGQAPLDSTRAENALAAQRAANPATWDQAATERYRAAASATREGRATFGSPTVGPVLRQQGGGGYRMAGTNVAGRLLQSYESAQQALAAGVDPAALRGALVEDLSRRVGSGPISQAQLDSFLKAREGALRAAPDLAPDLQNVTRAQARVDALAGAQKAARDEFTAGAVGRILGGDPGPQITAALNSRNAVPEMMRLRQMVGGDADAVAGLERAVADHVATRFVNQQTGQINPQGFRRYLTEKAIALRTVLSPDGMRTLEAIANDLARPAPGTARTVGANRGGTPSAYSNVFRQVMSSVRSRPAGGGVGAGLAGGLVAGADVGLTGGLGIAGLAIGAGARQLRAHGLQRVDQILAEAAVNPAFGRALLMKATPQNMPWADRAMRAALTVGKIGRGTAFDIDDERRRRTR